ncbi:hypothetical protein [Flavobacterium sp.]|uniref:hypothetical protein n=1 Tax=Flavobacterium sp. TaxID=239 RepID=UPI0035276646
MKNIFIILVSFVIFSCEKKEKSYEELEAEVLSDVLPDIIHNYTSFIHLLPPPPEAIDSSNYSIKQIRLIEKNQDSIFKAFLIRREEYINSIKILAKQNKKLKIGMMNYLISNDIEDRNEFIELDEERLISESELLKSTLDIKLIERDSIAAKGEFFDDSEINGILLGVSRVSFNKEKNMAYFEIYRFLNSKPDIVIAKKVNNKWVLREYDNGFGLPLVFP